ncbi:hypothetical protein [Amycolatopsis coloradensis]|uniref:hypothetical protein n=1 Tax=Amycolatopsis coloradensis TaxID=76021 RepID=UPI001300E974|nr:hypothetical protein [Amycolatopsis coloradensis]
MLLLGLLLARADPHEDRRAPSGPAGLLEAELDLVERHAVLGQPHGFGQDGRT